MAAALAATPAAHAARITLDRGTGVLTYEAAAGEANDLAVTYDGLRDELTLRDAGAAITSTVVAGPGNACRATRVGTVCTAIGIATVGLSLGDRDDALSAGIHLRLRVDGGAGADRLACGSALDVVVPDPADTVDPSCEVAAQVQTDPAGPAHDPAAHPGDGPVEVPADAHGTPIPAPDLVLPLRPVTLDEPGIVEVSLGCSAEATAACSGDIYVEAPAHDFVRRHGSVGAARGRHSLRQRRLGHRRFRIEQGRSATTRVPLLRGHYVMRNRRKRVRGRVLVVQRDASGKVLGSTSWPVALERKWSRRGKQRRHR